MPETKLLFLEMALILAVARLMALAFRFYRPNPGNRRDGCQYPTGPIYTTDL